jgi:hypothetical protein
MAATNNTYAQALSDVVYRAQVDAIDGVIAFVLQSKGDSFAVEKALIDEYKASIKPLSAPSSKPPKTKRKFVPNGYSLFSKEVRPTIVTANPGVRTTDVMKLIAAEWKSLDEAKKGEYKERAGSAAA